MKNKIELKNFGEAFEEQVDIFICSSSFEERCFSLSQQVGLSKKMPKNVLICYNSNEYSEIIQNANILYKYFPKQAELLELDSNDPLSNTKKLNLSLEKLFFNNKKGKNILLDTTTFTHETLLILIRLLSFKRDQFNKLFIGYVGADDYSVNESNIEDRWLSTGISDIRSVIGYPGVISPAKAYHLIVLFGFESERTRKLIEDYQFDKVSIAFGENPIKYDHLNLNHIRHKELLKTFPYAEAFQVDLSNPFSAKEQILHQVNKFNEFNNVIAPMNNKISTIGVGLAAIDEKKIQLIYAKPTRYNASGYSVHSAECYIYSVF